MSLWLIKARTALALGLPNIARVVSYRLGVKMGLNPVRRLWGSVPQGPFFRRPSVAPLQATAVNDWQDQARLFGRWSVSLGDGPPDWLANPLTGIRLPAPERAWWEIPDFDPTVGDIKLIWEFSRMDWLLAMAQRVRQGEAGALERLEVWLADWCRHNPPYTGPNWKCGQEASIRVIHLSCAALLLGQADHELSIGLRDLLVLHLQRIAPTVQYAMAQDNNHGTSEAVALFIGGSWLAATGVTRGAGWSAKGRSLLENRAARLIGPQGSFSQYSINYHRVMLDTFCMAEVWRKHMDLPAFSANWQARSLAAAQWLRHMLDSSNGDGPNLGANDGARLLQLSNTAYRDYRPSVQLGMALFAGQRAYSEDGPWNHPLQWLGVELPSVAAPPTSDYEADDGGFVALRRGAVMAMLRYPRFRFRPSQADVLHLDLWLCGENLLRDAGTYSYNTEQDLLDYFSGTASHNTVQFDGCDQMPRISRFLFGAWLRTSFLQRLTRDQHSTKFAAGYCDGNGAAHNRRIELAETQLRVVDEVSGFKRKAVLRWRLSPGEWKMDTAAEVLRLKRVGAGMPVIMTVEVDVPVVRCALVEGWESPHYLEKMPVPVLEIEIQRPGTLKTELSWTA